MADLIPFFYYDIIARLIPGGATLMVIAFGFSKRPFWESNFFSSTEHWNSVLAPLVLGGLAYAIGVLFEGVFSILKRSRFLELKAWELAVHEFGLPKEPNPKSRTRLWEKLVLAAALEGPSSENHAQPGMKSVFAHCHRFQAEYKMCQHLTIPTLMFIGFTFFRHSDWFWTYVGFVFLVVFLIVSVLRDKRRWWQLLMFAEQLGWIQAWLDQEENRQKGKLPTTSIQTP